MTAGILKGAAEFFGMVPHHVITRKEGTVEQALRIGKNDNLAKGFEATASTIKALVSKAKEAAKDGDGFSKVDWAGKEYLLKVEEHAFSWKSYGLKVLPAVTLGVAIIGGLYARFYHAEHTQTTAHSAIDWALGYNGFPKFV